ncbi:hypothetical protein NBZ79_09010 [Sneathiella marina]|uniref:Uncharacterized protein n=1 Tax=Sneathiella marina TaxID=2950108 RepID=A0ABY4WAD9_9PROT|nr:hypothetical protein [Sneathiella marina]USG63113.1 hypothetical protein NBZ79_09010 [Sneathiella marina]
MKYTIFLISILFLTGLMADAEAQSRKRDTGISAQEIMKLKDVDILGINLTHTMGEIMTILKQQGLPLTCGKTTCTASISDFTVKIEHKATTGASLRGPISVDKSAPPFSIGFSQAIGDPANCIPIQKVVNMFCSNSHSEYPCAKDNFGVVTSRLWSQEVSPDDWFYRAVFSVKPPEQCGIRMLRSPNTKRKK